MCALECSATVNLSYAHIFDPSFFFRTAERLNEKLTSTSTARRKKKTKFERVRERKK